MSVKARNWFVVVCECILEDLDFAPEALDRFVGFGVEGGGDVKSVLHSSRSNTIKAKCCPR